MASDPRRPLIDLLMAAAGKPVRTFQSPVPLPRTSPLFGDFSAGFLTQGKFIPGLGGTILLGPDASPETLPHELGHAIDHRHRDDPRIDMIRRGFRTARQNAPDSEAYELRNEEEYTAFVLHTAAANLQQALGKQYGGQNTSEEFRETDLRSFFQHIDQLEQTRLPGIRAALDLLIERGNVPSNHPLTLYRRVGRE